MRTARRLGIRTVAVYSDADANAVHVRMADEAVRIGPPQSQQSYLNIAAISEAIQKTGAQAVHPGYGFLSENAEFVKRLDEMGVTFIGPPTGAMRSLGDKIESKRIAKRAGVHIVPGFDGVVAGVQEAAKVARAIGYPVMIKASAGGGGKGMRIAWSEKDVEENFRLSAAEARSSFADDRLLIEKYIEHPRHIEIQLIADTHGNVVYLPERECSIQRRNQKVVEEAPSPAIDDKTRRLMGEQAAALARSVNYASAGTVEFMVDRQGKFYFLEMNTRLQVEHPITEYITGLDLVELMIRVAAGERLPLKQADVRLHGWAVESRVYAEDPKLFLPCIGTLQQYREPARDDAQVRCDSGVREGSEISIYYDPLICKLSTHGPSRQAALRKMQDALDGYVIRGVTHNIPLLRAVVGHPAFVDGRSISTAFLEEAFPGGFAGHILSDSECVNLAVIAGFIYHANEKRCYAESRQLVLSLHVTVQGRTHKIDVNDHALSVDSKPVNVKCMWTRGDPVINATIDGADCIFQPIKMSGQGYSLQYMGTVYNVDILTDAEQQAVSRLPSKAASSAKATARKAVHSPMPGQIVSIPVSVGDLVREGAELLVVEAMKMQNVVRASQAGRVRAIFVTVGQNVGTDKVLVEIEEDASARQ